MHSVLQAPVVHYWRDKRGHEVDFILTLRGQDPIAIECKWKEKQFEPTNMAAFRNQYPAGQNWIVCQDVARNFTQSFDKFKAEFISMEELSKRIDRLVHHEK